MKPFNILLTGLSGAGKTTIAKALMEIFKDYNIKIYNIDGDEIRKTLCKDLGFSPNDKIKNLERIIYLSKILNNNGISLVISTIFPYHDKREIVKKELDNVIEVYVNRSLSDCIRRDTKGLYARALNGEITHFTGISDPYEPPTNPDIIIDAEKYPIEKSCQKILRHLFNKRLIDLEKCLTGR